MKTTKAELRDIRYKLSQAIKLNKQEVRNNNKPHQRDLARMRRNILQRKISEINERLGD